MIGAPRTVLLVDDDAAARLLYARSLPGALPEFQIVTAPNGAEALAVLAERPIEVLVTDLHMPVMDGFQLLAHVRERYPNLGVVVLSSMPPEQVARTAPNLATYRRVPKPVPPAALAAHVRAAAEERVRGHIAEAPLAPLLHLLAIERSTCALLVRSGARKGRLHFRDGELVNAYAFELDRDGEAAARYLLAWDRASVDFERSLHNHVRTVRTPLDELLLDVARERDERTRDASAGPSDEPDASAGPSVEAPSLVAPRPPVVSPLTAVGSDARPIATPATSAAGDATAVTSRLDHALGALADAFAALRQRSRALPGQLDPTLREAEAAAQRPLVAIAGPGDPAHEVDTRLAELARRLAERAAHLERAALDTPAAAPTWAATRAATRSNR